MRHILSTAPTFSLVRSLDFLAAFPPCKGDFVLGANALTGAFAIGDRAVAYPAPPAGASQLAVETDDPAVVPMVGAMLGVDDQLARFYDRAAGDAPAFRAIVRALRGLHHVRFRTLAEV